MMKLLLIVVINNQNYKQNGKSFKEHKATVGRHHFKKR